MNATAATDPDSWFHELPPAARGGAVSVGNFDGVHLGHRVLLDRLRAVADRLSAPAIAVSFEPHPRAVLQPGEGPKPLTRPERRLQLLRDAGVDHAVLLDTTERLLALSGREFFERVLVDTLRLRGIVEGVDFRFGRDRGGTMDLLRRWGSDLVVEDVSLDPAGGSVVSSSRIRRLIDQGRVAQAAVLLGRPHRITGTVVHGAHRGTGLGFPTANLDAVAELLPADGVYAVRADGRDAVMHVGANPTFEQAARKVEVHLLDATGDLYGRTMAVALVERLRDVRSFSDADTLRTQIGRDINAARAALRTAQASSAVGKNWSM